MVTGTSVVDGYTTPYDSNTNGIYDFQEASAAPSISVQPSTSAICPGCSATMAVVATNVSSYQWQVFNGVSWSNLTYIGVYNGTTTGTLIITNTTPSENGKQYHVVLTNQTYVCDTTTSITATLIFRVAAVISNRRITYSVKKN